MTVKDTSGLTSTATASVTVSAAGPTAALSVSPGSGQAPLLVSADASGSKAGTNAIASYTFDWGDGSLTTGPQAGATAGHTYTSTGTFTVTVTVKDTSGLTSAATASVTVGPAPPTAALSVSPASGQAPLSVSVDASGSTAGTSPIASYNFAWGDGSSTGPQPGATASHLFAAGTYTVTVTVTDQDGSHAQASTQVTVAAAAGNLVGNSSFESGLSGWNTAGSGAGVTLTQASGGHSGAFGALLTNTSSTRTTCLLNDNPSWVATTHAGVYTASLWVKAAASGASLSLRLSEVNGATQVGSNTASIVLSTSWQQITVTYKVQSPGSTLDYNAFVTNAASGTCFYADDASIMLG
jgi:PKD repeat protein